MWCPEASVVTRVATNSSEVLKLSLPLSFSCSLCPCWLGLNEQDILLTKGGYGSQQERGRQQSGFMLVRIQQWETRRDVNVIRE